MTQLSAEDQHIFQHLVPTLGYHQILLRDEYRNRLFYRTLKRVIKRGCTVLDIGSGSGVWAIAAARLGAKKVVAIEGEKSLMPVIHAHVKENGVADIVEVINGISTEIKLRRRFDVVISETIGNQAFDEGIIPTMADARKRFLVPGGEIIPQRVALMAAPASVDARTPSGVPIAASYLRTTALNLSYKIGRDDLKLLSRPSVLIDVDFRTMAKTVDLTKMQTRWKLSDLSAANGITLWAKSQLHDGIVLDNLKTTNWSPVMYPFEPFVGANGWLDFELSISDKQYHWTVGVNGSSQKRSYTPVFAFARWKFDSMRLAGEVPSGNK